MKTIQIIIAFLCINTVFAQQKQQACISKAEMDSLVVRVEANRSILVKKGKLQSRNARQPAAYNHDFIWPLRAAQNYIHKPSFYYISNYVDLNSTFSATNNNATEEDYNCGTRTYDTKDYNHSGIDIAIGPYSWKMIDDENVEVIAAEGGTIVDKHVGEPFRNCDTFADPITYYGNFIAVEHSDGVTTYYMHMKNNTLTTKIIGDDVVTGEYLGKVGSSGNSSGPHLHFEVRSYANAVWDPFQNGACADNHSGLIGGSFWANEEPYINKKILSVYSLLGAATEAVCDTVGPGSTATTDIVPYSNHFAANTVLFFSAAVRDIENTNSVRFRILGPSDIELYDETFVYFGNFKPMHVVALKSFQLGSTVGTYRIICYYNGLSESHYFTVGCPPSLTLTGNRSSNSYEISGGHINSTETILTTSQNVENQAETYLQLDPGFTAVAGCEFTARIDNCTLGGLRVGVPDKLNKLIQKNERPTIRKKLKSIN